MSGHTGASTARSFIRWLGGRQREARLISTVAPSRFGRYFEPFLGSGALFFALGSEGRLRHGAFLSDVNEDLILAYRAVRDEPSTLVDHLADHVYRHTPAYFRAVRALDRGPDFASMLPIERAARFIYVTNAAYRNSWRVDQRGRVTSSLDPASVPDDPSIAELTAACMALRPAAISRCDFRAALNLVESADLVFLDPPYLEPETGRDLGRYAAPHFGWSDRRAVWDHFRRLADIGAYVVLLDRWSDDLVRALGRFRIQQRGNSRSDEALVMNWDE